MASMSGLTSICRFIGNGCLAKLAGLQVAAVMSVLGAFVIKPRMEALLAS